MRPLRCWLGHRWFVVGVRAESWRSRAYLRLACTRCGEPTARFIGDDRAGLS